MIHVTVFGNNTVSKVQLSQHTGVKRIFKKNSSALNGSRNQWQENHCFNQTMNGTQNHCTKKNCY